MTWRLAHSLVQLQRELDSAFPGRVRPDWTLGDRAHATRASDHNPFRGVVTAIDVRGRRTAQALWNHLLQTRDPRVKYMIFDGQIVSSTTSAWVPRRYTGSNPHTGHIHISVGRGPSGGSSRADLYDSTRSWNIGRKGDWFSMATKKDLREVVRAENKASEKRIREMLNNHRKQVAVGASQKGYRPDNVNLKAVEQRIIDKIKEAS